MLQKGKSLAEIVEGKNYSVIEVYCRFCLNNEKQDKIFAGCCSYLNGKLQSLNGDLYSLNTVYID